MMKKNTFSRSAFMAFFTIAVLVCGLLGINGFSVTNAATTLLLTPQGSAPVTCDTGNKGVVYVDTGGKLQICDGSSFQQAVTSGGASSQVSAANVVQGTFGSGYAGSNNQYIFKPTTNTTAAFQVQNAAGTTIVLGVDTSNARVGIGTAGPGYNLHVVGDARITAPSHVGSGLMLDGVLNLAWGTSVGIPAAGQAFIWHESGDGSIRFKDSGGDTNLVIDDGGNVGIGDTSPLSLLTVGSGDLFQINSSGVVVAGTWQGTAIADAYIPNSITIDSATNFSGNLAGDVTGTQDATIVGNDSHTHGSTTVAGLTPMDFTSQNISIWTNNSGYITNDTSVAKNEIANSGTLGFTWADSEVANDITASNYYLASNPSGYITNDTSVAKNEIANSGTLGFTWADSEVVDTITASNYYLASNPSGYIASGSSGDYTIASNGNSSAYSSASLELRELNHGGAQTGAVSEAPHLSFHWSGRVASQIVMPSDGTIQIRNNPGTGYETLKAGTIYTNDVVVITAASTDTLTNKTWNGVSIADAYIDNGITASNYVPLAGGSMTGQLTVAVAGTDIVADKIDATTIDPVYTIGGKRYATYMAGMTGVKEETTGVFNLQNKQHVIDFNNMERGSDLWLFAQAINVNGRSYITEDGNVHRTTAEELFDNITLLLTPGFDGRVWYEKDVKNKKIKILADKNGEVSYRLTAPRFDSRSWGNYAADGSHEGLNLDKSLK